MNRLKKIITIAFLCITTMFSVVFADFDGASMPIVFVPNWEKNDFIIQRHTLLYSSLTTDDLMLLPSPKDIHTSFLSYFTYMTLFTGAYMDPDRGENVGSHNGVDIRAPLGTPVDAIADGVVEKILDLPHNKYVTIRHENVGYEGKIGTYFSSYLHLSAVLVRPGDVIKRGELIGEVGMTGKTTTPHLHLQIDRVDAPFLPYWPFTTSEAHEAGYDFFEAVSQGLNKEQIHRYSVDPLDFIEHAVSASVIRAQNICDDTDIDTHAALINTVKNGWWSAPHRLCYPDAPMTREAMLALILRSLNISQQGQIKTDIFADIDTRHWLNPLITVALEKGIIAHDTAHFHPGDPVTRREFLNTLIGALPLLDVSDIHAVWRDIPATEPRDYALFVKKYALIDTIDTEFGPDHIVTRSEGTDIISRYLQSQGHISGVTIVE